jgi:hypothetical protein
VTSIQSQTQCLSDLRETLSLRLTRIRCADHE